MDMKSTPGSDWIPGKKSNGTASINSDDYGPKDTTFHEQRSWRYKNFTTAPMSWPEEEEQEHLNVFVSNTTWIQDSSTGNIDILWIILGKKSL